MDCLPPLLKIFRLNIIDNNAASIAVVATYNYLLLTPLPSPVLLLPLLLFLHHPHPPHDHMTTIISVVA